MKKSSVWEVGSSRSGGPLVQSLVRASLAVLQQDGGRYGGSPCEKEQTLTRS